MVDVCVWELEEPERKQSWSGGTEGGQLLYIFYVSHREEIQPETPMMR